MKMEQGRRDALIADFLTLTRVVGGIYLQRQIRKTPPEERTWKLGATAAVIAVTDWADGIFGRRAAPNRRVGKWLDQLTDKALITPIKKAQAETGEISSMHWKIKLGRDIGVTATRLYADHQGVDVGAQPFGKIKTIFDLGEMTVNMSPLSARPGLQEDMARASSSMALASGGHLIYNLISATRRQNG